ncbi:signal-regulatory protein beta-2-like [Betta splendens]|uniref:Signal-regulatory protein beta-2-like n=1 Tax=Betta splendens TaxID=158456 RepID=A0A6P7NUD8_BETSP|nr:signal-regulatory protein beta-2-like [Betta splendens]
MLIILYLLLVLRLGRSTDALIFETNTAVAGDDVILNCTRETTDYEADLFWIRLVSGKPPEVLGGTYSFDYDKVLRTLHFTTRQEPGSFLLEISGAEKSDVGVYYCLKVKQLNMTFVKGVFLRVKGPEPDVTAIIQHPPSDPVRPGDSVTLQCSVVSDSHNNSCPAVHSVYWFRPGPGESHPSVVYAPGSGGGECERRPEAGSAQTCVQSFCRNVSSSDAGTYRCAVATCGHILFGTGTKVDVKASAPQAATVIQIVLSAALTISLVVNVFLIHKINRKTCDGCAAAPQTASGDERSQQSNERRVTYSAPSFTKRRTDQSERSNANLKQTFYSDVMYVGNK